MEKDNRIKGAVYTAYNENNRLVESAILDIDNAKLLVTQLGGELGLDLHEVAKAMGLEFSIVKRKRDELKKVNEITDTTICRLVKVGFVELSQANRISLTAFATYNENNRLVDSYILDVENAKFLVTKTDTEIGDSYTRMEKDNRIKGVVYTATIDSGTYT
jgi:hypothetical protein